MGLQTVRELLENRQIIIYFGVVILAAIGGLLIPGTPSLEVGINPTLAFMLFVTFLQVPLADLRRAIVPSRFLAALLVGNFIAIPILVLILAQFLPVNPMVRLGVLIVLLSPCIDYVVTFTHLGRGNTSLLVAATPVLLIVQMIMLPVYLGLFLGGEASGLVQLEPFLQAFLMLIALPLVCAALLQLCSAHFKTGRRLNTLLGLLPVPATALVLFVVVISVVSQIGAAAGLALRVVPFYIAFAVFAPVIGWFMARLFRLEIPASRSIAFSTATRNSLVVLPLALAVPGAVPVLPAIIVTQTLVELAGELIFVRVISRLGRVADSSGLVQSSVEK